MQRHKKTAYSPQSGRGKFGVLYPFCVYSGYIVRTLVGALSVAVVVLASSVWSILCVGGGRSLSQSILMETCRSGWLMVEGGGLNTF